MNQFTVGTTYDGIKFSLEAIIDKIEKANPNDMAHEFWAESAFRTIISDNSDLLPEEDDEKALAYIVYTCPDLLNYDLTQDLKDGRLTEAVSPRFSAGVALREAIVSRLCDDLSHE